jgi:hypothetical protein
MPPPLKQRSGPTCPEPSRFSHSHHITNDRNKHSNPKSERQALRAYRIYSKLRLAEAHDPDIRFDHAWKRQVDWAFASFYRSFERLVAVDRVTQ